MGGGSSHCKLLILLMEETLNLNCLGCKKLEKLWDKLPTSTGDRQISSINSRSMAQKEVLLRHFTPSICASIAPPSSLWAMRKLCFWGGYVFVAGWKTILNSILDNWGLRFVFFWEATGRFLYVKEKNYINFFYFTEPLWSLFISWAPMGFVASISHYEVCLFQKP